MTVRGVANDAGVSTRAVYTLFGSRLGLLQHLFTTGYTELSTSLLAVPETDDPIADLLTCGHGYRRFAQANPHLYHVMFSLGPNAIEPTPEGALAAFGALVPLQHNIERALGAGRLVGDPGDLVMHLWSTVHGLATLELGGFGQWLSIDFDRQWEYSMTACLDLRA